MEESSKRVLFKVVSVVSIVIGVLIPLIFLFSISYNPGGGGLAIQGTALGYFISFIIFGILWIVAGIGLWGLKKWALILFGILVFISIILIILWIMAVATLTGNLENTGVI